MSRSSPELARRPDGKTDIDGVVGKNLKGWILCFVLGTIGKSVLTKTFENSVKVIETRHVDLKRRDRLVAWPLLTGCSRREIHFWVVAQTVGFGPGRSKSA